MEGNTDIFGGTHFSFITLGVGASPSFSERDWGRGAMPFSHLIVWRGGDYSCLFFESVYPISGVLGRGQDLPEWASGRA